MRKLLLTLLVLPWLAACPTGPPDTIVIGTVADTTDLPECPHSYDRLTVWDPEQRAYVTLTPTLRGPDVRRNVPEYHDCQKFVVVDPATGNLAYDSLFAIFASSERLGPRQERVAGPAAEILAWGSYAALGIERGNNCLYMWREVGPGGPPEWRARMIHTGPWGEPPTPDCADEIDPNDLPAGTNLDVHESLGQLPAAAFPPVARWGWSQRDSLQTIELGCAEAWCAVVPPGSTPPRSYRDVLADRGRPPDPGVPADVMHRYAVKGWYDEQLLAFDPDPTDPASDLVPTGIVGRFFPQAELGSKGAGDFPPTPPDDVWELVGYVALEVPDSAPPQHMAKYRSEFGLVPTAETAHFDEMNRISLCQGSRTDCGVPTSVAACAEDDGDEPLEWWARVDPAGGGSPLFRCVTRRGAATGVTVPGTARWRWAVNDEGMWERCVQGCCEMIGEDEA